MGYERTEPGRLGVCAGNEVRRLGVCDSLVGTENTWGGRHWPIGVIGSGADALC
jgi:hypothetical protein